MCSSLRIYGHILKTQFSTVQCISIRHLMRAIQIHQFGGPDVLQVNNVEVPEEKENEVLVQVKRCGINPVDVYIREGGFAVLPPLPIILGKEASGVVLRKGKNVTKFKEGDRVYCCLPWNGGYAENVVCSQDHTFTLSNKLSFSQGAGIYVPYFTAYRALVIKCQMKAGEKLLVHGASGGVGIAAVQLAKQKGLCVVGTAGTEAGLEVVKRAGADYVFNHREENHLKRAYEITDGKGFDVLFENMAHVNLGNDLMVLSQKARLAVVGSRNEVKIIPRHLIYSEAMIVGIKLSANTQEEMQEMGEFLLKGANEGWVNPIVDKEFDFDCAKEAHNLMISNRGARGKLIFKT
ncbi:Quinone oxidoreductase [Frankliniella fusca]|uniref:Quinone oxidoreductase n=1 Tax=Frankliniella fusca TaxID=407009 RepID=A0AAE1HNW8_9NEOP|nr:Quinone oxidoreductase [Frankliniella fusca]